MIDHSSVDPEFHAGDRIGTEIGDFEVQQVLGAGGMGVVYQVVRDARHGGRQFAIKTILPELLSRREVIDRFEAEGRVLSKFDHENIIKIDGIFNMLSEPPRPFILMELLQGYTLRYVMDQYEEPLSVNDVCTVAMGVCNALEEIHKHNVVHRDIKPDNIFIQKRRRQTRVVLIDFGIMKVILGSTGRQTTKSFLGSYSHASPEQLLGKEVTPRSDFYSLAASLYEMLTGTLLFPDVLDARAIGKAHIERRPAPLHERAPLIAPEIADIVMSALEKDPSARPKDAHAFRHPFTLVRNRILREQARSAGHSTIERFLDNPVGVDQFSSVSIETDNGAALGIATAGPSLGEATIPSAPPWGTQPDGPAPVSTGDVGPPIAQTEVLDPESGLAAIPIQPPIVLGGPGTDPTSTREVGARGRASASKYPEEATLSRQDLGDATAGTSTAASPPRRPSAASSPPLRPRALTGALVAAGVVAVVGALAWRGRTHGASPIKVAPELATLALGEQACTTNAECVRAHGGDAWHCHSRRHACVPIVSEDCKAYAQPNDAEADDVVWLGGIYGRDDASLYETHAAELARQDFAHALGSSAGRAGPLHARPIALAICDEEADASRAARHLAEDVEVPAVIGFRSAARALQVIPTELLPNDVLSVVTLSQASEVTRVPEPADEPRLVWRTTLDYDDAVRALARFVSAVVEPAARAAGLARPLRIAAVWPKGANHDLISGLFAAIQFNGKSAVDNGANFRQFVMEGPGNAPDDGVVDGLLSFAPQVVFYADEEFFPKVLVPLEARWRGGLRPTYLTASGLSPDLPPYVGRDASKRHRFFAVTNLSTTEANAQLVLHYNMAYPHETVERSEAPQPSYDAFYLLAYGIYALGDAPITGPALSTAFDRLVPPGRRVEVGPTAIYDAFTTLRGGAPIDLIGAIGSLDFDRATGEAPIDYAIICMGVDDEGAASVAGDSGLVYDRRADKLVGTLRCP